jgi:hypothetical protein
MRHPYNFVLFVNHLIIHNLFSRLLENFSKLHAKFNLNLIILVYSERR